ncbi:hypothetical protein M3M33_14230, partial [Loigolactobacillus coryniformis]|uniref:hypothetical protein n=1 Tax=Loigolactobacillus coryniformis TaxID=1610 RepID=UPI00201A5D31
NDSSVGDFKAAAKARAAAKDHSEEVFKRIGWRSLIPTIIDKGFFETSAKTKIEAVYTANFQTAVRLLSIENALS